MDDIVVYSDSWECHVQSLEALFDHLVEANLTVNLAKCEFARATVTYLGKVAKGKSVLWEPRLKLLISIQCQKQRRNWGDFWVYWVITEVFAPFFPL